MFDMPIKNLMESKKLIRLEPQTMVNEAAKRMESKNVGAVLVVEGTQLLGIFTERDAVFRVLAKGLDAKTTSLRDVMTTPPATLPPHSTYGHALMVMHDKGFRHVPVSTTAKNPFDSVGAATRAAAERGGLYLAFERISGMAFCK